MKLKTLLLSLTALLCVANVHAQSYSEGTDFSNYITSAGVYTTTSGAGTYNYSGNITSGSDYQDDFKFFLPFGYKITNISYHMYAPSSSYFIGGVQTLFSYYYDDTTGTGSGNLHYSYPLIASGGGDTLYVINYADFSVGNNWSISITVDTVCLSPVIYAVYDYNTGLSNDTISAGGQDTITVSGTLNSSTHWQWYSGSCGGTAVDTGTTIIVSPSSTTVYYVRAEGGCPPVQPCTTDTVTLLASSPPSISISASPSGSICPGTSVTFTATPTNGSSTPSYQWKKNSSNVGTNSNTYSDNGLSNGDIIQCVLTTLSLSTASSNTITMSVKSTSSSAVSGSICPGGSYNFNGSSYTTGGTYTAHLTNSVGCDSAVTLTLTVKSTSSSSVNGSICPGGSYTFNGSAYNTGGTYTVHLTNSVGCDSAVTLNLTVNSTSSSSVSGSICPGGSYNFNGSSYTTGGTYTAHLTNSVGCDSAVTLNLTVNSTSSSSVNASICPGGSYTFNGSSYSTGGTYTAHLTNSVGCDSAVTLTLTVNSTSSSAVSASICSGGSYTFNGTSYTSAGTYTAHLTNSVGCDSAVTLTLSVSSSVIPTVSIGVSPGAGTCSGTLVTFTATGTNGGSTPAYQWKKNSANVGTNSNTYSVSAFTNGDTVKCVYTSSSGCASPSTATSNAIVIGCGAKATFTSSAAVCTNGAAVTLPITFTGSGPWQFKYSDGSTTYGPITSTTATYNLVVSPAVSTTYTLISVSNGIAGTIGSIPSRTVSAVTGGTVTPAISTVCNNSSQNFTLSGSTGTIQWQYAINSDTSIGGWTNYGTAISTSTLNSITSTRYVRAIISAAGCAKVSSSAAQVNADPTTLNVTASAITSSSALISWNFILGATYNIVVNGTTTTGVTSPYTVSLNQCSSNSITVNTSGATCTGAPTTGSITVNTPATPLALTLTAGSGSGIKATWTAGVGPYKLYYGITNTFTYSSISVTGTTYTLTTPTAGRSYVMYVVDQGSTCAPKAQSNFAYYNTGSPTCGTSVPNITSTTVTSSGFTINYSSTGASTYEVYLKVLPSGSSNAYNPSGTTFTSPVFAANTCVQVLVNNRCGATFGYSSAFDTICTSGNCTTPANLVLSNPTCHGFTSTWNAASGAVDYSIFYTRTTGAGAPVTLTYRASTNAYTINTLASGGYTYSVYVKSNCTGGGQTPASNVETISTLTIGCKDDGNTSPAISGSSNTSTLSIYPNPNKGEFTIDLLTANRTDNAHIQIINMLGQEMSDQIVDNNNGQVHTTLNDDYLPAGVYFVKMRIGNETHTARIVIQK